MEACGVSAAANTPHEVNRVKLESLTYVPLHNYLEVTHNTSVATVAQILKGRIVDVFADEAHGPIR